MQSQEVVSDLSFLMLCERPVMLTSIAKMEVTPLPVHALKPGGQQLESVLSLVPTEMSNVGWMGCRCRLPVFFSRTLGCVVLGVTGLSIPFLFIKICKVQIVMRVGGG